MGSRAFVLRRLGRYDEAVESLERAISLDPANPALRAALAETFGFMGRQEAMQEAVHEALVVDGAWTEPTLVSIVNGADVLADIQTLDLLLERMPAERRESGLGRYTRWRRDYLVAGARPDPRELRQLMQRSGGSSPAPADSASRARAARLCPTLVRPGAPGLPRHGRPPPAGAGAGRPGGPPGPQPARGGLARLGDREAAVAEAERVIAWVRRTDDRLIGGWALLASAVAMETLGDRARATALLGEALDQGRVPLAYLRTDPALESLRADPHVRAMLEGRAAREGAR
jgi:tetratricopeptide (TPR) repeat protein